MQVGYYKCIMFFVSFFLYFEKKLVERTYSYTKSERR